MLKMEEVSEIERGNWFEIGEPPSTTDKISDAIKHASEILLGYSLKPKQLEAVSTFMSGKDTFVCLPTGYGKSAVYAILPIAFDYLLGMLKFWYKTFCIVGTHGSIAVVFSPLIHDGPAAEICSNWFICGICGRGSER